MPMQERYSGTCGCGGKYDVPLPEYQTRADAWKKRHEEQGHMPRSTTYTQKIGPDDDAE
jgi:hypothetical protein